MANALYDKGREKFLRGEISWSSDTIKAVLVDTADYTASLSTHEFLSDIPAGAREETSGALASKTTTAGVADAADVTFTAAAGDPCEALVLYKDTGSAATSPLIAYIDTATGLPVVLNGGDVVLSFDSGANKIFKL